MLINRSYFIGQISLPQLGQPEVEKDLNNFINRLEEEILVAALGYDLYKAFIDGLTPGSDEQVEQKWLDLRDGIVFTTNYSVKKAFKGFANNTTKESILANVIYVAVLRANFTQQTGIGTVKPASENAATASPDLKMCDAWFSMWQQVCIVWEFLIANKTTYTQYQFQQIDYSYFQTINPFGI